MTKVLIVIYRPKDSNLKKLLNYYKKDHFINIQRAKKNTEST